MVTGALSSTVCLPAAALLDATDLLDVDVDQVAWCGSFVAKRRHLRRPDDLTGQRIALTQQRDLVSTQDRAHGAGRDAELGTEPVLTTSLGAAQLHHALLDLERRASWTSARTRRPIGQTGFAGFAEASDPTVRALPRDTQLLRNVRDRSPLSKHPFHEQTSTMHIQTSISVGHEDLLVGEDVRHLH